MHRLSLPGLFGSSDSFKRKRQGDTGRTVLMVDNAHHVYIFVTILCASTFRNLIFMVPTFIQPGSNFSVEVHSKGLRWDIPLFGAILDGNGRVVEAANTTVTPGELYSSPSASSGDIWVCSATYYPNWFRQNSSLSWDQAISPMINRCEETVAHCFADHCDLIDVLPHQANKLK